MRSVLDVSSVPVTTTPPVQLDPFAKFWLSRMTASNYSLDYLPPDGNYSVSVDLENTINRIMLQYAGKCLGGIDELCRKPMVDFFSFCDGQAGTCLQVLQFKMRHFRNRMEKMFSVKAGQAKSALAIIYWFTLGVDLRNNVELQDSFFVNFVARVFHGVYGIPAMFVLTAFDVAALIVSLVLLVLALRAGFWLEKKAFLALLALLCVSVALGACYWTFLGVGYQDIGTNPGIGSAVSLMAVQIVGGLTSIALVVVFSLFAWVVIGAVLETFYPERQRLRVVSAVAFAAVAVATTAYTLAMTVVDTMATGRMVVNASEQVMAGVLFGVSAVLAATWAMAYVLVGDDKKQMRRNAVVFLCGSSVLAAMYLAMFVVAMLSLLVDQSKYGAAQAGLQIACHVATVVAIAGYVGTPIVLATLSTSKKKGRNDNGDGDTTSDKAGYVPLADDNSKVPERYQNF